MAAGSSPICSIDFEQQTLKVDKEKSAAKLQTGQSSLLLRSFIRNSGKKWKSRMEQRQFIE
jgi:hypothetical protein